MSINDFYRSLKRELDRVEAAANNSGTTASVKEVDMDE